MSTNPTRDDNKRDATRKQVNGLVIRRPVEILYGHSTTPGSKFCVLAFRDAKGETQTVEFEDATIARDVVDVIMEGEPLCGDEEEMLNVL